MAVALALLSGVGAVFPPPPPVHIVAASEGRGVTSGAHATLRGFLSKFTHNPHKNDAPSGVWTRGPPRVLGSGAFLQQALPSPRRDRACVTQVPSRAEEKKRSFRSVKLQALFKRASFPKRTRCRCTLLCEEAVPKTEEKGRNCQREGHQALFQLDPLGIQFGTPDEGPPASR